MKMKKYIVIILILMFFLSPINILTDADQIRSTDLSTYQYKQIISIPFDTSIEQSKFYPVDIKINFENPCYAADEKDNSVRIGCEIDLELIELESQIYDLKKTDDNYISSCNVVFLIPENADGKEEYYVFYDSEKKDSPDYEKHIELTDSHYFYEPISGQKIDLDYYGIKENDNVIYGICQTGELLGNPIALSVLKFKPNSKIFETYNIDQLAVFDMRYGINPQPGYEGTSWAENVKKTVLVDGNLMVRVRLEAESPKGNILSDNIYTYYHSPTENKKIVVDCYHEILSDIYVEEPSLLDGTYGGIVSIKSRSSTIEKMNVGSILPKLYVYTEDETINDFSVPQNPSTIEREAIISTEDDIDLGNSAWLCSKDPDRGIFHGLIVDSNKGFTEENDGIQVKSWVKENINYPGLEADTGNLYISRNSYENKKHNPDLIDGFNVNYKVEFFTIKSEKISNINDRSEIFQNAQLIFPSFRKNITSEETEKKERFNLTTYVHMATSFPLGSLLSARFGKKLPYIYAELYKDNTFKSSGSVGRLTVGSVDLDLEGKTLIGKIRTILGIFDFKKSSFFKRIVFPDLEEGRYVIKIFRENPFFSDERKYIGYGIVDVDKNTTLRIFCTSEAKSNFKIKDQDQNGIKDAEFFILSGENIIADERSDKNGTAKLSAPASFKDKYKLRILYKGFLVSEEEIKLGFLNHFKELNKNYKLDLYDLNIRLKDLWGYTPEVDVNIFLESNEMVDEFTITSEKIDRKNYIFKDLLSSKYDLFLKYKSFELKENIDLKNDDTIDLLFPAEYKTDINFFNLFGEKISNGKVIVTRNNKKITLDIDEDGHSSFIVPPGEYRLDIVNEDEKIAFQDINIKGSKKIDIVTDTGSLIHYAVTILGIIGLIISFVYMIYKKKIWAGLKLIVIFLIVISIFQPWWVLNGDNSVKTTTTTTLYPPKMVSFTEGAEGMGGSVSILPPELTSLLTILSVILFVSIIFILLSIVSKNRFEKTSKILSFISIIPVVITLGLFYYALSLLTELGVGSFMGTGQVMATVPGQVESVLIDSSWGPGLGFYIALVTIFIMFISLIFKKKFKNKF